MNKSKNIFSFCLLLFFLSCITQCRYDHEVTPKLPEGGLTSDNCYPDSIAAIIGNKCAVAGCHNTQSKDGAGGFDMSSWNHLFEGGRNGSSVIPYRADQSFLMYFINTYSDLGITLLPVMPVNVQPLTRDEVITMRDWINSGAPDCSGNIKFSGDLLRKKFYVCNQGCDIVTVFDSQTHLPMRIINVGITPQIESPHELVVSPDGNYWYVIFYTGTVMQKFRTSDDSLVGQVTLGAGLWSILSLSSDSHYAFVVDFSGTVAFVDLQTMTLQTTYAGLDNPHGCCVSDDMKTLYVTAQFGNYIYKMDITNPLLPSTDIVILEKGTPQYMTSRLDPHQVDVSPDGTEYFVTCQKSNELRVMSVAADTLLTVIPIGGGPQEIEFSETHPYTFITCMNDSLTNPGSIGTISVVNYLTKTFVKSIYTGWQPHGAGVDDNAGMVYVANRSVNANGPAPHHSSTCGGRNGNITIIDMNTLELLPGYKVEVSVDPYEVGVR